MFRRLVLAIDTSPAGDIALSFAISLAKSASASVHVVHINEFLVGSRGLTLLTENEASELVQDAVSQLAQAGIAASGSMYVGSYTKVAAIITEAATRNRADAIILGSRRHRRIKRLFSGGIREKTTRLTALPVLTSPSPLDLTTMDVGEALRMLPTVIETCGTNVESGLVSPINE